MIAITGGGTGGHLAIARTFCLQLKDKGIDSIFIGSTNGQDKMWFENDENFTQRYFLKSSGVVNKKGLNKLYSLANIINLSLKCKEIFRQNSIKLVISVGGYSAAPAAFAAKICGLPLFIHEQNAINGRLNSILKPFCKGFFSSYEAPFYTYPVNQKFFKTQRIRDELKTILFLGGSQGANFINQLALKLALNLKEKGIKIIHQCGKNSFDEIAQKYLELGLSLKDDIELFEFDKEIEHKISKADLAITRAGASSLWELTANGLPCIFVPFAYAAQNHQFYNAKFLSDKGLAKILMQDENININEVLNLIQNYDIKSTSELLLNEIKEQNTNDIINTILNSQ